MGLFGKTFRNNGSPQSRRSAMTKIKDSVEWDSYFSNVNGKLASLFVNLALHKTAPMEDKPYVVWVSIKMNNPREDGLSSNEESNELYKIEDSLVDRLNAEFKSVYVGRVTSEGDRDLYFYFGDTSFYDKTISDVMKTFPAYSFDFGAKEDKTWSGYLDFLYPTPRQFESMLNRRVIHQLEKEGDKLAQAREVDHWIYFKTDMDREVFLSKIKAEGFSVVNMYFDKSLGKYSYALHIKRVDKVDFKSVDSYVIHLWEVAEECNGDYDGWETSVEKN